MAASVLPPAIAAPTCCQAFCWLVDVIVPVPVGVIDPPEPTVTGVVTGKLEPPAEIHVVQLLPLTTEQICRPVPIRKNCEPRIAPVTSVVLYALTGGIAVPRFIRIVGGVGATVCVAPVIAMFAEKKHGLLACGQNLNCHCELMGEMALLEGMLILYAPEPFIVPETVNGSVPPVHV